MRRNRKIFFFAVLASWRENLSWSLSVKDLIGKHLTCTTKPNVMVSSTIVTRKVLTTMGCRQLLWGRIMAATSSATNRTCPQVFTAIRRIIGVRKINAADPLPSVARKIQNAVGARPLGKTIYRGRLIIFRFELGLARFWRAVSPRELAPIGSPCCLLPFCFGG